MPGAYTSASMPPSPSTASAMPRWADAASVTSHSIGSVPGPASAAASWSRSLRRASNATCAPRCASPTPMQRPSPLEAPTMTARTMGSFRGGSDRQAVQAELPRFVGGEAQLRVLDEPVTEPGEHHRLLYQRGGAADVGGCDRAGG